MMQTALPARSAGLLGTAQRSWGIRVPGKLSATKLHFRHATSRWRGLSTIAAVASPPSQLLPQTPGRSEKHDHVRQRSRNNKIGVTLVGLPDFSRERAKQVLTEYGWSTLDQPDAKGIFTEERKSSASLYVPKLVGGSKSEVPVVLFGHGFTQPPDNYLSTLEDLAEDLGAVVIAPETGFCDAVGKVPPAGAGKRAAAPTKMQAALIVDMLRSAAYIFPPAGTERATPDGVKDPLDGLKLGPVTLVGHSMGSGVALVVAAYIKNVIGVAIEAPAVAQMSKSPVNPNVYIDGLFGKGYARAKVYFRDIFPKQACLHILGANQDQIVPPLVVAELFGAARESVKQGHSTGVRDVKLFTVDGSHIGFEDKVSLEFTDPLLTAVFGIINLVVYRDELLRGLLGDYSDQKAAAQAVLVGSLKEFYSDGREEFPPSTDKSFNDTYQIGFKTITERGDLDDELAEQLKELTIEGAQDVPKTPADDSPSVWVPSTILLLSYALEQAAASVLAGKLLLHGWGSEPTGSSLGMAATAAIAAALIYENALLAGGRFIGAKPSQLPLLQALSKFRYVAHAFAPALAFVAAEMASRGGVSWAHSLGLESGIGLVLLGTIASSFVESYFLLETKPMYRLGILNFGYKTPTFSKVVPVITATVLMAVLGVAGYREDPLLWPLAAGPIAAFVLSAVPSSKAPTWLTGNFGEVLLLASLVASENILRSQGL